MDIRKNILKNTFKFMVSFIIINILFLFIIGAMILYLPTGKLITDYAPMSKQLDPDNLDWVAIDEIGGWGIIIDSQGNVIKSYYQKNDKKDYTYMELMNLFDTRGNDQTVFSYTTMDNNKLLIIYPASVFTSTPSMNILAVQGSKPYYSQMLLISALAIYIFLIYQIISKLTKRLKVEFDLIKAEEDKKENMFFRGLAHDIKTPLSTMIAYTKALEDGIVEEKEVGNYYKSIYNNGIILKERVDNMMNLTLLGDEGIFSPEKGDILEDVRRFIGDNYSWFIKNNAIINIEFNDEAIFVTKYDQKLFGRLLENLLQNSVHHNKKSINIFVGWHNKDKILTIKDDGIGIPEKIKDYIWEPMLIGDESRTGEKLRGMGLANVKRIVELHGWNIEYDGKFKIWIK